MTLKIGNAWNLPEPELMPVFWCKASEMYENMKFCMLDFELIVTFCKSDILYDMSYQDYIDQIVSN